MIWLLAAIVLFVGAVDAGPLNLKRKEKPERVWEERGRGRPGADARPIIDGTLDAAGLPKADANNPWRDLVNLYFRLDHMAQGEPRSYTEGKFVPNAWFTHGGRHLLDLMLLIGENKDFVKDVFHAQGLTNAAAKDQAFKDLLIALIGHDSQQIGFASPREAVREQARIDHPFAGGVETSMAYLKNAGTNPAGVERAILLGVAAAGHSKSAVDFANPNLERDVANNKHTRGANVMFRDLLAEVNKRKRAEDVNHVDYTFSDAQRDTIVGNAKRIATVLGAMDALRERGPGTFGAHPTGESMVYRATGTNATNRALEVVNTAENKVVVRLEGITHRSYVEYHTVVEDVRFNGTRFDIRVNFADADIPTNAPGGQGSRRTQVEDIQKDFARTGFPCVVSYKTAEGGWATYP